jgi:glycosyltransferase involved in cell wall biosynthesis
MKLLEVLPSVTRNTNGELEVDTDFVEALRVYLENFETVTVACPVATKTKSSGVVNCRPVKDLPWRPNRITFLQLPSAYAIGDFFRHYFAVRKILKREIELADYIIVSPHTLIGDWPTVAAREAIKLHKPYVLEADVVYETLAKLELEGKPPWKRAVKKNVLLPLFMASYRYCLKHSSVSFFQGADVYDAYAKFCDNPHNIHYHLPIYADSYITENELQKKLGNLHNRPLKICYAGRAIDMKGPMDWLDTIDELLKRGVAVEATWFGDGPLLPSLREVANARGISDHVSFPGFVTDQNLLMDAIKTSDIFLYCHKTRESARVLGEALARGCPLIGYGGAYPSSLVEHHGGGLFAGVGDWGQLADYIQHLDKNRGELWCLIRDAARSGRDLDRDAAMRRKIALIKKFAGSPAALGHPI